VITLCLFSGFNSGIDSIELDLMNLLEIKVMLGSPPSIRSILLIKVTGLAGYSCNIEGSSVSE